MDSSDVKLKRRQLLDAIYAIHSRGGMVKVDLDLAAALERAWSEYDGALTSLHREAQSEVASDLTSWHFEPIDALAKIHGWSRAQALAQIVDDWALTFDWGQPKPREIPEFRSEYA